jgi:tRNA(fMet)-specific endonuclease VapC
MKYFLDTNICIYFLNNRFPCLVERLASKKRGNIKIPVMAAAELAYGAQKSVSQEKTLYVVKNFLDNFEIAPFDNGAVGVYGEIRANLEKKGEPIGANDLIIAAIALAQNGTLVTHNTGEFMRVEGLQVEDWTNC